MLMFVQKKRRIVIGVVVVILLVVGLGLKLRSNGAVETVTPIRSDLVRQVEIAGKVIPSESVELGFEIAGTVSSVNKSVGASVRRGDVLAQLDSSAYVAEIRKAEAELALAQANLAKLEGAGAFEAEISSAKSALIQTIIDAYTAADDAVHNKTDQIFLDPRSSMPEMKYAFGSYYNLRDSIIRDRATMDERLADWQSSVQNLSTSTYTPEHLRETKTYLSQVSIYINNVAQAVNLFESSASLSQSDIDDYKADALAARNNMNTATQDLIAAEEALQSNLSDVPVQVARVESAHATLLNNQSQLTKTRLVSPISGVVAKQDAKVGQAISGGASLVSVISTENEVEAYVPEVLVSEIRTTNQARVTLDAYGSGTSIEAQVVHIDPAETIRDGVSTYRIRLAFQNNTDTLPKPGMTANIEIETFRKSGVLTIPERAVVRSEEGTFVYIMNSTGKPVKTPVEVGERGSSGEIEVISPLASETAIVINPSTE